jgi:hypothetical protein
MFDTGTPLFGVSRELSEGWLSTLQQVLQIVEALSQHAPEMLQQPDAVLAHLLPTLATLLTSSVSGDCRFLCLKLLCDVLLLMLGECCVPTPRNPRQDCEASPHSNAPRASCLSLHGW